jgi:hypothetical protein
MMAQATFAIEQHSTAGSRQPLLDRLFLLVAGHNTTDSMLAIGCSTIGNHSLHRHLDQLLRDYLDLQLQLILSHLSLDFT